MHSQDSIEVAHTAGRLDLCSIADGLVDKTNRLHGRRFARNPARASLDERRARLYSNLACPLDLVISKKAMLDNRLNRNPARGIRRGVRGRRALVAQTLD